MSRARIPVTCCPVLTLDVQADPRPLLVREAQRHAHAANGDRDLLASDQLRRERVRRVLPRVALQVLPRQHARDRGPERTRARAARGPARGDEAAAAEQVELSNEHDVPCGIAVCKIAWDPCIPSLAHEVEIYQTKLKLLQGTFVPRLYGLYIGRVDGELTHVLLEEYCGPSPDGVCFQSAEVWCVRV